ncbi:MAG: Lar family restriction alleviation protein [Clostridia bacterium]|nr:Lar family restriction alleviation protein [Clostridia bacterium]
MNEIKLKSCPFCGGKPYFETNHRAFINAKTTKVAYVRCKSCNARTERIPLERYGKTSHSFETELDAIAAWNKRVERIGKWIVKKDRSNRTYAVCSECGTKNYAGRIKYCYECGAKMEEIENE